MVEFSQEKLAKKHVQGAPFGGPAPVGGSRGQKLAEYEENEKTQKNGITEKTQKNILITKRATVLADVLITNDEDLEGHIDLRYVPDDNPYVARVFLEDHDALVLLDSGAGASYLIIAPGCNQFDSFIREGTEAHIKGVGGQVVKTLGSAVLNWRFREGPARSFKIELQVLLSKQLPSTGRVANPNKFMIIGGRNLTTFFGIVLNPDGSISFAKPRNKIASCSDKIVSCPEPLPDSNQPGVSDGQDRLLSESELAFRATQLAGEGPAVPSSKIASCSNRIASFSESSPDSANQSNGYGEVELRLPVETGTVLREHKDELCLVLENIDTSYEYLDGIHLSYCGEHTVKNDDCLIVSEGLDGILREQAGELDRDWKAKRKPKYNEKDDTSFEWRPIGGSPDFKVRERMLDPMEIKDTPQQEKAYEVTWDAHKEAAQARIEPFDFSVGLCKKLAEENKEAFITEKAKYVNQKWWKDVTADARGGVGPPSVICFPLVQGAHKNTKVRPVLDCREYNKGLGKATYRGPDCGLILREVRVALSSFSDISEHKLSLVTLDLKSAFYRIRLAGHRILVKSDGQTFESDRVTFGTRYGPCALEAVVRSLIYKALEAAGEKAPAVVRYYLDDFTIIGYDTEFFVRKLEELALSAGFELPVDRRNHIRWNRTADGRWTAEEFDTFLHLGVWFFRDENGGVFVKCKERKAPAYDKVTKRIGFALAGQGYDPLWMHPVRQSAADLIRRVVGSTPSWDETMEVDRGLFDKLAQAVADKEPCGHQLLIEEIRSVSVDCDASLVGFGYIFKLNGKTMLQRSRLWSAPQLKWDINRKELFCVMEALREFHPLHEYVAGVPFVVNTDNKSAVAWLNGEPFESASTTRTKLIILNWLDFKDEVIKMWKPYVPEVLFRHVAGELNEADRWSRLPIELGGTDIAKSPLTGEADELFLAEVFRENETPPAAVWEPANSQRVMLLQIWTSWRALAAQRRGRTIEFKDHPVLFKELIQSAQDASSGLKMQKQFLMTKAHSGMGLATLVDLTKYRFVHEGVLYQLRFSDGDITKPPTAVVVLDGDVALGKYIVQQFARSLHEERAHQKSLRDVLWTMSKLFTVIGMKSLVVEAFEQCSECSAKVRRLARRAPYIIQRYLDSEAMDFFDTVSIDLFTVPDDRRKDEGKYLLVLVDHFSRLTLLSALRRKHADGIAVVLKQWFMFLTCPRKVRSDNEPVFKQVAQRVTKLGSQWYFVPPYSPFSNGIVERTMRSVREIVEGHDNWPARIPALQIRLNSKKLDCGFSPFEVAFGRDYEIPQVAIADEGGPLQPVRDDIRMQVRMYKESRAPSRPPPARTEHIKVGDFVVKTYEPRARGRKEYMVTRVINTAQLEVMDIIKKKRTVEHLRNIVRVSLEFPSEETGGTSVEVE